jgi:hypothetical protein
VSASILRCPSPSLRGAGADVSRGTGGCAVGAIGRSIVGAGTDSTRGAEVAGISGGTLTAGASRGAGGCADGVTLGSGFAGAGG